MKGRKLNKNHPDAAEYTKKFWKLNEDEDAAETIAEGKYTWPLDDRSIKLLSKEVGKLRKQLGKDIKKLQEEYSYLFTIDDDLKR